MKLLGHPYKPGADELAADVASFEDITSYAAAVGIKDPVLVDPAILSVIEVTFAQRKLEEHELIRRLVTPLRWLSSALPGSTEIIFTLGPREHEGDQRVPVCGWYCYRPERGYHWVITILPIKTDQSRKRLSQEE